MINKINKYIINITNILYNDIYHIANPTLSRNPYMSDFLNYYLGYKNIKKISLFDKLKFISKYFIKFYVRYFIYIIKFVGYKLFFKKNINLKNINFIIDVNFILNDIIKNNQFKDSYLPSLAEIIKNNNLKYTYIVKSFIGNELNIVNFFKTINILKQSNENIISEYDLLNTYDLFKIFIMAHIYPFKVIFIKTKNNNFIDKVFKTANIEALDSGAFRKFIRYFTGKNLANNFSEVKLISFCEYKCHDKIFYKGIKDTNQNIYIYGCQFFVNYPVWLNTIIPKEEEKFGVVPDEILVNGKANLNDKTIKNSVGASLRYKMLFDKEKYLNHPKQVLILLSFVPEISRHILEVAYNSKFLKDYKVIVRKHPVLNIDIFKNDILNNSWILDAQTDLKTQFKHSSIVITSGSGTALEAVVKAKSVIMIENKHTFLTNPLSENIGKKIIWDTAKNSKELDSVLNKLFNIRKNHIEAIKNISNKYLELYFSEPTNKKIESIFHITKEIK